MYFTLVVAWMRRSKVIWSRILPGPSLNPPTLRYPLSTLVHFIIRHFNSLFFTPAHSCHCIACSCGNNAAETTLP